MSEAELLRAVLAAPDADAPRLAYADGVAATDPERAQLIRAQIAATHKRRAGASWGDEGKLALTLLGRHHARWTPRLPVPVTEARFYRGFVELVATSAEALLGGLAELARVVPLRHADVTGAAGRVAALAAASGVARLVSLGLAQNHLGDADAAALAGWPRGRLRWLDLARNQITVAGLDDLAAAPNLRGLDFIDLMGNPCGDPVDRPAFDGGLVVDVRPTERGRELEARHGELAWLHGADRHRRLWPPERGDY
ncbi:MAG: TIGR02996 domain-containing protein [Kofleriaceae bacterium]